MAYSDHLIFPFDGGMIVSEWGISACLQCLYNILLLMTALIESGPAKNKKSMMDGFREKEGKGGEKEERSGATPVTDSCLLCFSSQPGTLLAKAEAATLSPNEGARQPRDVLGSHE